MIFIDTHVVIWLYEGRTELFSEAARKQIDNDDMCISPMVELELVYLREINRLRVKPKTLISDLQLRTGLKISGSSFPDIVACAHDLKWIRDPFDRLIVAQVILEKSHLVTADKVIRKHFARAVW
ncbi:MAG: hypothetical protein A2161_05815 [Candidatus Schekmanbacteria bacterium RBG_13_48_7]|uniref:PIN domain-containing protein n=1 Tax=Candidatus Schekmanbacteria bacterium RBG_13_48_7 TaxID=1817878 RepID=A0A1F7RQ03_9BACT|nr:MAG: hypothetical protein A2161_05815 [Candidatus Schekmanbacteria bacterium RBG_13_48_7]